MFESENNKKKALVLFSGGQDSTTCLFLAKKQFDIVQAIGFDYGQRHKKELTCACEIAKIANVNFEILSMPLIGAISANSLTRQDIAVDKATYTTNTTQPRNITPPNSLVEGRNMFFIGFAGVYAKEHNIKDIFIGVSQTDYSGYPDCRKDFIDSMQSTMRLCLEWDFVLHTPLMHLNKADTWKLADELGVADIIKHKTLTCYNGIIGEGCGECPSCVLRIRGYHEWQKSK